MLEIKFLIYFKSFNHHKLFNLLRIKLHIYKFICKFIVMLHYRLVELLLRINKKNILYL